MFYKNFVFRFNVDDTVKQIALKTINKCFKVREGIVQLITNDCVIYTISMDDSDIPLLLSYYDDYVWEKDSSLKGVEFIAYSVVSRLYV